MNNFALILLSATFVVVFLTSWVISASWFALCMWLLFDGKLKWEDHDKYNLVLFVMLTTALIIAVVS